MFAVKLSSMLLLLSDGFGWPLRNTVVSNLSAPIENLGTDVRFVPFWTSVCPFAMESWNSARTAFIFSCERPTAAGCGTPGCLELKTSGEEAFACASLTIPGSASAIFALNASKVIPGSIMPMARLWNCAQNPGPRNFPVESVYSSIANSIAKSAPGISASSCEASRMNLSTVATIDASTLARALSVVAPSSFAPHLARSISSFSTILWTVSVFPWREALAQSLTMSFSAAAIFAFPFGSASSAACACAFWAFVTSCFTVRAVIGR